MVVKNVHIQLEDLVSLSTHVQTSCTGIVPIISTWNYYKQEFIILEIVHNSKIMNSCYKPNTVQITVPIYVVIFEGRKFCGFCCKLVGYEILILKRHQLCSL